MNYKRKFNSLNRQRKNIVKQFHSFSENILNEFFETYTYKKVDIFDFKIKINELSYNNHKYNVYFNTIFSKRTFNFNLYNVELSTLDTKKHNINTDNITINPKADISFHNTFLTKLNSFIDNWNSKDIQNKINGFFEEYFEIFIKMHSIYINYQLAQNLNCTIDNFEEKMSKLIFLNNKIPLYYSWGTLGDGSINKKNYEKGNVLHELEFKKDKVILSESYLWNNELILHRNVKIKKKDFFDYNNKNNIIRYCHLIFKTIDNLAKEKINDKNVAYQAYYLNSDYLKFIHILNEYINTELHKFNLIAKKSYNYSSIEYKNYNKTKEELSLKLDEHLYEFKKIDNNNDKRLYYHVVDKHVFDKLTKYEISVLFSDYSLVTKLSKMAYLNLFLNQNISDAYKDTEYFVYNEYLNIGCTFKEEYDKALKTHKNQ